MKENIKTILMIIIILVLGYITIKINYLTEKLETLESDISIIKAITFKLPVFDATPFDATPFDN